VDAAGAAYVVGSTASDNFPAAVGPGYETSLADDAKSDAFVVKLAANGLSLTYATFLGGISYDFGNGIAVDAAGAAYVTDRTQSSDFPATISSGYDNTLTGSSDAFAVKLSSDGLSLGYATFLGGNNFEEGLSVAVDATGAAYYTGYTASADFPTTLAYDTTQNGSFDAYVVKLATDGLSLLYGTFIGGATDDEGYGIVLDDDGAAYIAGYTASTDFPAALGPGYDDTYNDTGASDGFLVKLAPDATSLEYATFLGGDDGDSAYALAMGPANAVYVTGYAKSTNFPASLGPGYDTTQNGSADAFVVKLITGAAPVFVPLVLR